ncbi:MAG: TIGR03915 family putative DNA repair protein [Eubacteriaceae bacterium]
MDYLYDYTFEGLLTCLYLNFNKKETSGIYPKILYQTSLINNFEDIQTDIELSNKMYANIKKTLYQECLKNIYNCFLSDHNLKEKYILDYLNLGFNMGIKFTNYHTHKAVFPLLDIVRKVKMECHRYLGYVRFKSIGTVLYSAIHPQYNILPLISYHFADRLRSQQFIIHDKNRNTAIISNNGDWIISPFNKIESVELDNKDIFESLWKKYFETVGIENRYNPKLQQNFVPLKYRKDLIEFK